MEVNAAARGPASSCNAAAPSGIKNISGVACHVNSALLLMAHCGLPLHPAVGSNRRNPSLCDWLSRLQRRSSSGDHSAVRDDEEHSALLEECYSLLRESLGIEVEELGDPVISLRKMLDMHDPSLSGGILQTKLVRTVAFKHDANEDSMLDNNPISSKQLKPTRMPNPLPIPSNTVIEELFRTRVLSEEPVNDYKWPVVVDDGDDATTRATVLEAITIRTRTIVDFPEIFMIHLPLQHFILEIETTTGRVDDPPSRRPNVPMRIESLSTSGAEIFFELTGAILHISSDSTVTSNDRNDDDEEEEEGGHTATLIQWTAGNNKESPENPRCSWYLIDDHHVHQLECHDTQALLAGCRRYRYSSEPDEMAYTRAVLLVYRKRQSLGSVNGGSA
jgi:hypothetical protein